MVFQTISIVFPLPTRYTVRLTTTAFEYFAGGVGRYNIIIIYYINIYTPSSLYHKLRDYYIICLYTHIIIILYYVHFRVLGHPLRVPIIIIIIQDTLTCAYNCCLLQMTYDDDHPYPGA